VDYEQKSTIKTNTASHPTCNASTRAAAAEASASRRTDYTWISAEVGSKNKRYGKAAAPEIITFYRHQYEQRTASKTCRAGQTGAGDEQARSSLARFRCCPTQRQAVYQRSGQRISKTNSGSENCRYGSPSTPERIAACERGQKIRKWKIGCGQIQENPSKCQGETGKQGEIGKLFQYYGKTAHTENPGERYCCATAAKGVK